MGQFCYEQILITRYYCTKIPYNVKRFFLQTANFHLPPLALPSLFSIERDFTPIAIASIPYIIQALNILVEVVRKVHSSY